MPAEQLPVEGLSSFGVGAQDLEPLHGDAVAHRGALLAALAGALHQADDQPVGIGEHRVGRHARDLGNRDQGLAAEPLHLVEHRLQVGRFGVEGQGCVVLGRRADPAVDPGAGPGVHQRVAAGDLVEAPAEQFAIEALQRVALG